VLASIGITRNSEAVGKIVSEKISEKVTEKVTDMIEKESINVIKNEIKNNLKVRTSIKFPQTFNDGYLKTEVIYDNEIIHESTQVIKGGSMAFSF